MKKQASINDLILFCLLKKDKYSFDVLVKECFKDFPDVFCFSSIKKWPDARKLDGSLRKLRKSKLIKGSPQTYFSLTFSGRKRAEETAKIFWQEKLKI